MPGVVTRTVDPDQVSVVVAKLEDEGYLIASIDDVTIDGVTKKQITAKHKNMPERPGMQFVD